MFNGVNFSNALSPASWNEVSGGGVSTIFPVRTSILWHLNLYPENTKPKIHAKKSKAQCPIRSLKRVGLSSEAFWGYSWCILNIDFEMKHYKIEVFQDIECIFDSKAPLWREGQPQITSKCASIYLNNIQQGLYEHFASFKG